MQPTIDHLNKIIHNYTPRLEVISNKAYADKPRPDKWSKQEILGHLIDSAQNNIRRFIVAQYEDTPFIRYNQDEWVKCSGYQTADPRQLVALWGLLNRHLAAILAQIPAEAAGRKVAMGGQPQTLTWVAADYCNHLLHHLHQILEVEPIAYPG
jgi:DinB family protein